MLLLFNILSPEIRICDLVQSEPRESMSGGVEASPEVLVKADSQSRLREVEWTGELERGLCQTGLNPWTESRARAGSVREIAPRLS